MTEAMLDTINHIMREANIDVRRVNILDYDCDRIYLAIDGEENNYNIRLWDINDTCVRYSLFKFENGNTEEVIQSHCFRYAA